MKIRKYRAVDPTQIQLCNNSDGEFLHVNDIELYLMKEREGYNSLLRNLNIEDDSSDNWHKRYAEELKNNIELIDKILKKIIYDRS